MSKIIFKNSLKADKKFRASSPIQLFRSLVSCFGLALLSMAGNCPWLAQPPQGDSQSTQATAQATAQESPTNDVIALDPNHEAIEQPT